MKSQKELATIMTATMLVSSTVVVNAATTDVETIIGKNRIETAIKISKDGWISAETVILVNDSAIPDALTATPLAYAKNAPILITGKDKLNKETEEEIKRLGAKNVILIGGDAVLSANIEKSLKDLKLNVDRINGATREETALLIAKRLDGIKDVSEIAVVNSVNGLADAVSVAAVAAEKGMPILLANPKKGLSASEKFIKDEAIKTSYIIGGTTVLPEKLVSSLPSKQRIEGLNRNDTNAKVIEKFYGDKELDNLYLAKDGRDGDNQLIDALAVGVLAAKNGAPVLIASKKLNEKQEAVVNTKKVDTITQVGGNGNEGAFDQLKDIEKEVIYKVETVEELNEALEKANANDVIEFTPSTTVSSNVTISTNNAVEVNLKGNYTGTVTTKAPNADIVNKGTVSELVVENGKNTTVTNTSSGKIDKVEVDSSSENIKVENNGTITQVENNASGTNIDNNGTITKPVTGTTTPTIDGNKPGGGSSSGGGTVIPSVNVSSIVATVYRNDITVSADVSNAGSNKATVELFDKEGNSVVKKENIGVTNGKVECKFESISKGEYTVKVGVGGSEATSGKVSVTSIEVNDEATLKTALKEAASGDTIYLSEKIANKNMEVKETIVFNKSVTLDLNGNTIEYTRVPDSSLVEQNKPDEDIYRDVMEITTSNIEVNIVNGNITNTDTTKNAKHNGLIISGCNNVTVNMNKVDINLSGYENKSNYNVIYPNGSCKEIYITLEKCNLTGADVGIYYPVLSGKLTINNSTIDKTNVALGVKGGVVEINDSTLVGYGAKGHNKESIDLSLQGIHPLDGGFIKCGEALNVECNYGRDIDVTVNNSNLKSIYSYAVRMQFFKYDFKRKVTINGGTVTGTSGSIYNDHSSHKDNSNEKFKEEDPILFKKSLILNSVNLNPEFNFKDETKKN